MNTIPLDDVKDLAQRLVPLFGLDEYDAFTVAGFLLTGAPVEALRVVRKATGMTIADVWPTIRQVHNEIQKEAAM